MSRVKWRIINFLTRYPLTWSQQLKNFFFSFSKTKNNHKVFCIGNPKTGTTSLSEALCILGYKTVRVPFFSIWRKKSEEQYVKKLKDCNYDAFIDFPIGDKDLYKKIAEIIPNSKFILTLREKQSFTKSYLNFYKGSSWMITDPEEIKQKIQGFEERNKQVIEYFKDKTSKLLIMNIINGDSWDKLCNFLNKPIPNEQFPHKNIGKYKKKR